MTRLALALRAAGRMPSWLIGALAALGVGGLIWMQGSLTAKRAAEIETLQVERSAREQQREQSEELRDAFDEIEKDAASGGDDAVLDRLRSGHFFVVPGVAAAGD